MPQPNDITQPVEELVLFLKDLLEPYGFRLGTDLSLKVAHLFEYFKVTTIAEVLDLRSKLAPVIVKNETEQRLFYQIMDNYEKGTVKEPNPKEDYDINIDLYKIFKVKVKRPTFASAVAILILLGSLAFILLITHLITLYTTDELSPKFEILQKDAVIVGQDVQFRNNTLIDSAKPKKDKQTVFSWKFDDSVIRSNEKLLTYRFLQPGKHSVSLSVSDSITTQSVTVYETCALFPDFNFWGQSKTPDNTIVVYIYNTTLANRGCVKAYEIDFGDSTRHTHGTAFDTVAHEYSRPGNYTIRLTAYNFSGKAYSISKGFGFGGTDPVYRGQLANIPPKTVSQEYFEKGNRFGYSILIFLAAALITSPIAAIIILIGRLFKRRKLKPIKQKFELGKKRTGAPNYLLTTDTSGVELEERRQLFDGRLFGVQRTNVGKIDINATIYSTIRKAGFPQLNYHIPKRKQDYIFLIDIGKGNNQQVALFELLIERGAVYGTDYIKYYYSHDPFYLSDNKALNDPFLIPDLWKNHQDANLIIFGDGYGFLPTTNQHFEKDQDHIHTSVLTKWSRKALITPVPRSNWSRNERALYGLLPIYPATPVGLELVHEAMSLPRHRQQLPSREDAEPYMFFPLTNEIAEYERFFLEDQRLLIWLYALALADNPNWAVTLVVGNALQENYFNKKEPLVTYLNLLKLTAVEWMQTGHLSVAHRQEMMDQLRKEPDAKKIIRITARALLQLSAQEKTEKGTLNETQKNIREEILQQWTTDAPLIGIDYLRKNKLLDNFNSKELQKEKKIKHRNNLFNSLSPYISVISFVFLIVLFYLHLFGSRSRLAQNIFSAVLKTDSFTYYNNIACRAMNRYDTTMRQDYYPFLLEISSPDSRIQHLKQSNANMLNPDFLYARANFFLNKAAGFPNKDTKILERNQKILSYTVAQAYLEDSAYNSGINFFNRIIGRDTIGLNALHGKAICYLKLFNFDSACLAFRLLDSIKFNHPPVNIDCRPKIKPQAITPSNNQAPLSVRNRATRTSVRRPVSQQAHLVNTTDTKPYLSPGQIALGNAITELNAGARAYTINGNRYMGPFVAKYNAIANLVEGVPWACTFVSWCFNKDSVYFKPMASTNELEMKFNKSLETFSMNDSLPIPGDIYFYNWDNYKRVSKYRAIGIISSYDTNKHVLKGIEGNSNDAFGQNYKVAEVFFPQKQLDSLNFRFFRVKGKVSTGQSYDTTYPTTVPENEQPTGSVRHLPVSSELASTRIKFAISLITSILLPILVYFFRRWRKKSKEQENTKKIEK